MIGCRLTRLGPCVSFAPLDAAHQKHCIICALIHPEEEALFVTLRNRQQAAATAAATVARLQANLKGTLSFVLVSSCLSVVHVLFLSRTTAHAKRKCKSSQNSLVAFCVSKLL